MDWRSRWPTVCPMVCRATDVCDRHVLIGGPGTGQVCPSQWPSSRFDGAQSESFADEARERVFVSQVW